MLCYDYVLANDHCTSPSGSGLNSIRYQYALDVTHGEHTLCTLHSSYLDVASSSHARARMSTMTISFQLVGGRKPREGQSTIERKSIQHHETVKRKARESQVKVKSESQEEVERKLRESQDLGLAMSGHGRRVHVRRHGGDLQIHAPQLTRTRADAVL